MYQRMEMGKLGRHTAIAVSPRSIDVSTLTAPPMSDTFKRALSTALPMSDDIIKRMLVWEVRIARGCLDSFNNMLTAHSFLLSLVFAVNIIGFLQPPRGWNGNSGRMYPSVSLSAFAFFNSASLCTATSGLLFYIYCSHSAIVSLQWVPLPDNLNDDLSLKLLIKIRESLRRVTLPSLQRRCSFLFVSVAGSLTTSILAYFFAGYAATNPGKQRYAVVVPPAVIGGIVMLLVLLITTAKVVMELDFKKRLDELWITLGHIRSPEFDDTLTREDMQTLDPLPVGLKKFYYRKAKTRKEMLPQDEP